MILFMFEDAFCVSPNAWGGVLNKDTIPSIRAKVVCGACNNQLQFAADAGTLMQVCFVRVRVRAVKRLFDFVCPAWCDLRTRLRLQPYGCRQLQHGGDVTRK